MDGKSKRVITLVVSILMLLIGVKLFDYLSQPLSIKISEMSTLSKELELSSFDYTDMITDLEEERDSLMDRIEIQNEQMNSIEDSVAFLTKEQVLGKVSNAISDTGATFSNFYVTSETSVKNDYSVQIQGNIYQINKFIQNICIESPGISFGEFSIRENEDSSFLSRYFDESNTLIWYDGTIYGMSDIYISGTADSIDGIDSGEEDASMNIEQSIPSSEDIEYTMTITFRI